MRNFIKFNRLISLVRNKPFNHTKNAMIYKSDNLLVQRKLSVCNSLLSRNIYTSQIVFAKSKDRGGKEKKKQKATKVDLRELAEVFDVDQLTDEMNRVIENMKVDFIKNLTVRSTSGALEQIPVKMEGKEYQLQELAQIARKPNLVVLNVSTFPTAIPLILEAIRKSGLNINPQQDGTTVFLPIPKVTKEHRENLSKGAKTIFVKHKEQIQEIRNKAIKAIKKRKDISEDTIRRAEIQIDALYHKYVKEAEVIMETKQNELLKSHS